MTFRIRPARPEDLSQILRIERLSFPSPWSGEHFQKEFEKPYALFLVAEGEERILGYGCFWLLAGELQIANLAVDPAWRGRGIGEGLLREALCLGRARGAVRALLEVRVGNLSARRLYEKLGFRIEGRRKAYYRDTGEDALLMSLSLTESQENLPCKGGLT